MDSIEAGLNWLALKVGDVLPIPEGSKAPTLVDWPNQQLTADQIKAFLPSANIGIHWSGDYVDIDLDVDATIVATEFFLPRSRSYGREKRPDSHRIYKCAIDKTFKYAFEGKVYLEIRSNGAQSVVHGLHPTQDRYTGLTFGAFATIEPDVLKRGCALTFAATLIAEHWPEGGRHELAVHLSGGLKHSDWADSDVINFIEAVATVAGDEETQDRIRAAEDTCKAHVDGKTTGWPRVAELLPEAVIKAVRSALGITNTPVSNEATGKYIEFEKGDQVTPEHIEWDWPNHIARGALHVMAGKPQVGKTLLCLEFISRLTTGIPWPHGKNKKRNPVSCIIWTNEDNYRNTLVPRLKLMAADMSRIKFIKAVINAETGEQEEFDPVEHLPLLEAAVMADPEVGFIMIDPLMSTVSGDANSPSVVRKALQPVRNFADRTGRAVMGICHLTKGSQGRDPLERVLGSGQFGAVPRMVFIVADQVDTEMKIFCRIKSNLCAIGGGIEWEIKAKDVEYDGKTAPVPYIHFGKWVEGSHYEILDRAEMVVRESVADAAEVDLNKFMDKPRLKSEVRTHMKKLKHGDNAIKAAKRNLDIKHAKEPVHQGVTWWYRPEQVDQLQFKLVNRVSQPHTLTSLNTSENRIDTDVSEDFKQVNVCPREKGLTSLNSGSRPIPKRIRDLQK